MATRRSTVRIEEDLMTEIRRRALDERVSINRMINRLLRQGLEHDSRQEPPFKEKVYSMGIPRVDLTKALAIAAALEDEETMRKLKRGK